MEVMERMGRTIFCFAVVATLLTIALVYIARVPASGKTGITAHRAATPGPASSPTPSMLAGMGIRP